MRKDWEAALGYLERDIQARPFAPESRAERGFVLNQIRRFDEALASYEGALELATTARMKAVALRGASFALKLGRLDEAACYAPAVTTRSLLCSVLLAACTVATPRPATAPTPTTKPAGRWSAVSLPTPRGESMQSLPLTPPIARASRDCSETLGARTVSLASVSFGVARHALAVRGDAVGLAWVTRPSAAKMDSPPEVHLATLARSLQVAPQARELDWRSKSEAPRR